jgi:bloom syndrome protein
MTEDRRTVSVLVEVAGILGLNKFKPKQEEAIVSVFSGKDTFVSLPTGYGKSVVYAYLPLLQDWLSERIGSIVVCVSPLTSVMMDQRVKFSPVGLSTEFVGEMQTDESATCASFAERFNLFISAQRTS